jgi:hypothetical protein
MLAPYTFTTIFMRALYTISSHLYASAVYLHNRTCMSNVANTDECVYFHNRTCMSTIDTLN